MPLNLGIVGLGGLGTMHCKGISTLDSARIVAICDVQEDRLEGKWGNRQINIKTEPAQEANLLEARKYKDFNRLLRDKDVEAVIIVTPTFLHAGMAVKALRAGKNVFCEKPMALSHRDTKKMIQAAEQNQRLLQIGHVLRFWPEYVMIKQMIDDGRFGRPLCAIFNRFCGQPGWSWENWYNRPEMSGGGILDLHIHDVDLVNWYFGTPSRLCSTGVDSKETGIHAVSTQFTCDGVPMVVANGGWLTGPTGFMMGLKIEFENATVEYASNSTPTLTVFHKGHDGKIEHPEVSAASGYTEEIRYFIECVQSGKNNDRMLAADAAVAVKLVEAESKSVRTGKAVAVKL